MPESPSPRTIVAIFTFSAISILLGVAYFSYLYLTSDSFEKRRSVSARIDTLAVEFRANPQNRRPLDELLKMAKSSYEFGRFRAISTLGTIPQTDPCIIELVENALESEDRFDRRAAAESLAQMGKNAAPAKQALLRHLATYPNYGSVHFVAEALRNIGDSSKEVLNAIEVCVKSPDCAARDRLKEVYRDLSGKELPGAPVEP